MLNNILKRINLKFDLILTWKSSSKMRNGIRILFILFILFITQKTFASANALTRNNLLIFSIILGLVLIQIFMHRLIKRLDQSKYDLYLSQFSYQTYIYLTFRFYLIFASSILGIIYWLR